MRFPNFKQSLLKGAQRLNNLLTLHSLSMKILGWLGLSLTPALTFVYTIWGLIAGLSAPLAAFVAFFMFSLVFFFLIWLVGFIANFDEVGWGMVPLQKAAEIVNYRARDTEYIAAARAQAAFENNQTATNRIASTMAKNLTLFGSIDDSEYIENIPPERTQSGWVCDNGNSLIYQYDKSQYRYNGLLVRKKELRSFISAMKSRDGANRT